MAKSAFRAVQVRALLTAVRRTGGSGGPHLGAFFGCLYAHLAPTRYQDWIRTAR
jgi:hypothetical protein